MFCKVVQIFAIYFLWIF